ncbi:MAG: hypothetical protein ACTSUF_09660 [Candidatus Heimdallarchaeaceae archaeon]
MKKEIKWIFIGWLGFLFVLFLMWQLDIVLSGIQAIIIILLVLILGGIWIGTMVLEKNVLTGADTKKAFEFVQKWWKDVYNEELTNKWINCTTRYYGKEKFFGFIIRKKLGLEPVNIIVKAEPLDIARVIEIPEYAQTSLIHNPFYGFSPTLKGVPVNYPEAEWIGHQQPWRPSTIVNVGQPRGERELSVLEKKEERHE